MRGKILCVCTANSARSQMGEGLLRHLGGDRFEVYSAGVNPTQVNPLAVKVMSEIGIDISRQRSKSVKEFSGQQFDYVITVCDNAKQTCPLFPGKHEKIHWSLEDPSCAEGAEEDMLTIFRKTRNQIKENILKFLTLPKDNAKLKCPYCESIQEVIIPQNSCLHLYKCKSCHKIINPTPGSCCVICAYSNKTCPAFTSISGEPFYR